VSVAACIAFVFLSVNLVKTGPDLSNRKYASMPRSINPFLDTAGTVENLSNAISSVRDNLEIFDDDKLVTFVHDKNTCRAACINTNDKNIEWQSSDECLGYFVTDGGQLFCVISDSQGQPGLAALDMSTGKVNWRHNTQKIQPAVYTAPVILDSKMVCWTIGGSIYLFDKCSGDIVWYREIENEKVLSRPNAGADGLFVAGNENLYLLNIKTGKTRKRISYSCDTCNSAVPLLEVAKQNCYISLSLKDGTSRVMGLNCHNWEIRWDKQAPRITQLLSYNDQLLLRCQYVYSIERSTGQPVWHYEAKGCSPIECFDQVIVFVDQNRKGRLVGLSTDGGGKLWELEGVHSCSRFIKRGQKGFIKTSDGILHVVSFG
jgi:hypothetical protein